MAFIQAVNSLRVFMQTLVFHIQEMPNLLHDSHRVGAHLGVLSKAHQLFHQLFRVGHIEVASDNQVAAHEVALPEERMAGLNAVFTMGSIPQMPHVNLTGKGQILLYPLGVLEPLRLAVQALSQAKLNAPIDILHRLRLNAAVACDVTFPRRHTHLDASQSRAILATVVLLFHHQNHLIQAIQSRPIGFQVMV